MIIKCIVKIFRLFQLVKLKQRGIFRLRFGSSGLKLSLNDIKALDYLKISVMYARRHLNVNGPDFMNLSFKSEIATQSSLRNRKLLTSWRCLPLPIFGIIGHVSLLALAGIQAVPVPTIFVESARASVRGKSCDIIRSNRNKYCGNGQ